MGKGEIARHEQFHLFPQYFQNTFTADAEKLNILLERVESIVRKGENAGNQKISLEGVESIVRKGGNAGNQHFLLFAQCFQKRLFLRVILSRDCAVKSKRFNRHIVLALSTFKAFEDNKL